MGDWRVTAKKMVIVNIKEAIARDQVPALHIVMINHDIAGAVFNSLLDQSMQGTGQCGFETINGLQVGTPIRVDTYI